MFVRTDGPFLAVTVARQPEMGFGNIGGGQPIRRKRKASTNIAARRVGLGIPIGWHSGHRKQADENAIRRQFLAQVQGQHAQGRLRHADYARPLMRDGSGWPRGKQQGAAAALQKGQRRLRSYQRARHPRIDESAQQLGIDFDHRPISFAQRARNRVMNHVDPAKLRRKLTNGAAQAGRIVRVGGAAVRVNPLLGKIADHRAQGLRVAPNDADAITGTPETKRDLHPDTGASADRKQIASYTVLHITARSTQAPSCQKLESAKKCNPLAMSCCLASREYPGGAPKYYRVPVTNCPCLSNWIE